jgi:hypothetical protein
MQFCCAITLLLSQLQHHSLTKFRQLEAEKSGNYLGDDFFVLVFWTSISLTHTQEPREEQDKSKRNQSKEMTDSRCYFTRTRKGRIGCVVRERYFSEKIGFGHLHRKEVTRESISAIVTNSIHKTIFFLDTNIALHHIDLLETKSALTEIVVITHTLLKELRNLNYSVYKRMMTILNDEQRCFIFLPNENHHEIDSNR